MENVWLHGLQIYVDNQQFQDFKKLKKAIIEDWHKVDQIRQFCAKIQITVLPHPPYSPELTPYKCVLFSKF